MRRRTEYKFPNRMVIELVKENKRKVDEEFAIKVREKFSENKNLFGKEVKKERGGVKDVKLNI